jgi:hypothetical protein
MSPEDKALQDLLDQQPQAYKDEIERLTNELKAKLALISKNVKALKNRKPK